MPNLFTTSFVINGILGNSFTAATKTASAQMQRMSTAVLNLRSEQKILDNAYNTGVINIDTYKRHLADLQTRIGTTQQSYKNLQLTTSTRTAATSNLLSASRNLAASFVAVKTAAAPLVSATKTAMDFEAAMSKVGAITKADAGEMQQLSATAKDLGKQTMFSATQSAEAMSYLGMAGWDTQQILKGMPALLALAAAGGTDLARTADIVSDNLTAFG